MSQKIIPIETFTCKYIEREDRLLLTLNYKEIEKRVDFWITRAFLLKLIPHFFDYCSYDFTPTTEEINKNEENSSQTTSTDNSTYVLTQQEPLLLDSVDFKKVENNIQLVFKNTETNVYCGAVLDARSLSNVVNLITNSAPSYSWGINNIT